MRVKWRMGERRRRKRTEGVKMEEEKRGKKTRRCGEDQETSEVWCR